MSASFMVSVCVAANVALAGIGALRQPDPDRDALVALEQHWLSAEHDRAALDRILADDFQHPVPTGVVLTKAQHIEWAVAHPGPVDRRQRFEQMQVRRYGDAAIVTGVVLTTDGSGQEARSIFTDVFVRRAGRWQAVNAQENAVPAPARQ